MQVSEQSQPQQTINKKKQPIVMSEESDNYQSYAYGQQSKRSAPLIQEKNQLNQRKQFQQKNKPQFSLQKNAIPTIHIPLQQRPPAYSYAQADQLQNIPQQQVQTDDIDSESSNKNNVSPNAPNHIIQEEKAEQNCLPKKQQNSKEQESQQEIQVPQKKEINAKLNQVVVSQVKANEQINEVQKNIKKQGLPEMELEQQPNPKQDQQIIQQKKSQKRKKKDKKHKKDKKSNSNHPQNDNISNRLEKMQLEPTRQLKPTQQMEEQFVQENQQEEFQQDNYEQGNSFYEYIHPFLMLVGSSVIQSYMCKKQVYKERQGAQWAAQISSKVLLRAYFDGIDQPQELSNQMNLSKKYKIMQKALQVDKFYKKLQDQLNNLANDQQITPILLSKLFFLIKKFKMIASCIIMEKKNNIDRAGNVSSSTYWDKQKDGQINFSYEGKSSFVMLTLYGLENPKNDEDN